MLGCAGNQQKAFRREESVTATILLTLFSKLISASNFRPKKDSFSAWSRTMDSARVSISIVR